MKKNIVVFFLFISIFLLYIFTLPNINTGFADSDEFISVSRVYGVAHPSGYPLYTMLGILTGYLPLPLSYAGKINSLSAILHATTAVLVFFITEILLKKYFKNTKDSFWAALIGTLTLTISFSFWFFALFAEVFSLNNLLIAAVILTLLLWKKLKDDRLLYVAGFLGGLGLSNQQTILLLSPAFIFLVWFLDNKIFLQWKKILVSISCFIVGFILPYFYLPFAASHSPVINWGDPRSFSAIFEIIRRSVYADAQGSGAYLSVKGITMQQRLLGLQLFFIYLQTNLTWFFFFISIIGAAYLAIKKKFGLLLFLSLGILGSGLFFAFYSPPSISVNTLYLLGIHYRFYLSTLIFFSILIGFGAHALYSSINHFSKKYSVLVYPIIFIITIPILLQNFQEIKANDFSIGHTYGKTLLKSLEKNALLICYSEPSCFTAQYIQLDEKIRQDVIIIPADFIQQTPEQLKKKYPFLLKKTVSRINARHAVQLVREVINLNINKRPIYVAGILNDPNYFAQYSLKGNPYYLVPQGCAMKVSKTFTLLKKDDYCRKVEEQAINSFYTQKAPISRMIPLYLGYQTYFNFQQYYAAGCIKKAEAEYKIALKLNPLVQFATSKPPDFSKKDRCTY